MAEIDIAVVNAAITALIADPQVDYRIGDKAVKAGQKLTQLLAIRKVLMENPITNIADISVLEISCLEIDEFGVDHSDEFDT